ncbi:hypothetical protein C8J56DRAFT_891444 [Mycena floridula]|nr:hypothetical protein C8J56DRAFT_891420 [Mycena floridula]KAJ7586564.1 hypothetical protein C8J56DRAFT_891444 [Mycena floridula]
MYYSTFNAWKNSSALATNTSHLAHLYQDQLAAILEQRTMGFARQKLPMEREDNPEQRGGRQEEAMKNHHGADQSRVPEDRTAPGLRCSSEAKSDKRWPSAEGIQWLEGKLHIHWGILRYSTRAFLRDAIRMWMFPETKSNKTKQRSLLETEFRQAEMT